MPKIPTTPKTNEKPVATKPTAKKPAKGSKPELKYPDYKVEVIRLTAEKMKELIGWTTDKEEAEKAGVYGSTLTDLEGNKVYLTKNKGNRPFDKGDALRYGQDMLNSNWKKNGEGFSIGQYGNVVSGQHRGIGLILAEQRRVSEDEKAHWKKAWGDEPLYIDTHITYGVEENKETKRTVDSGKIRTLADVLYGMGVFDKVKNPENGGRVSAKQEEKLCRVADYAVKTLWERTGAKKNPFSAYRTHSESVEFLGEHPLIVDCVTHIWNEYERDWQVNSQRIPAGTAAAMMYLMATCTSDREAYHKKRNQKSLDLDMLDKAQEFWVAFADFKEDKDLKVLREEIGKLSDGENDNSSISAEKLGMLCKAWNLFKRGQKLTPSGIKVKRVENDFGIWVIRDDAIDVGGIDMGPYRPTKDDEAEEDEDLKERMEKVKKEKATEEKKKTKKGGNTKELVPVEDEDDEEEEEEEEVSLDW